MSSDPVGPLSVHTRVPCETCHEGPDGAVLHKMDYDDEMNDLEHIISREISLLKYPSSFTTNMSMVS